MKTINIVLSTLIIPLSVSASEILSGEVSEYGGEYTSDYTTTNEYQDVSGSYGGESVSDYATTNEYEDVSGGYAEESVSDYTTNEYEDVSGSYGEESVSDYTTSNEYEDVSGSYGGEVIDNSSLETIVPEALRKDETVSNITNFPTNPEKARVETVKAETKTVATQTAVTQTAKTTSLPNNYREENPFYIGGGVNYSRVYNKSSISFQNQPKDDEAIGATAVIGYKNIFKNYVKPEGVSFDIEGRIMKSFEEESYADLLAYSLFLKPQYQVPFKKDLKLYALLGLGQVNIEGENGTPPAHSNMIGKTISDDVHFQWGLGFSADMTDNLTVTLDYTALMDGADIDSQLYRYDNRRYKKLSGDMVNLGLTYDFNLNY